MAKKKCKCKAGAPEWMVTFSDMMTLLLCFFVLIVSFSEIKQDEWKVMVTEMQEALGIHSGGGAIPSDSDPKLTLMEKLEHLAVRQNRDPNPSNTDDPGMEGRDTTVTRVREGMLFAVGGRITFEPGSADLSDKAKNQLDQIVKQVRGYNNVIELRGHASSMEKSALDGRYHDLWELSAARAKAVMAYLTAPPASLNPERFRLIANADREPLAQQAYTAVDQAPNRRVEVLISEALRQQFTGPEAAGPRP